MVKPPPRVIVGPYTFPIVRVTAMREGDDIGEFQPRAGVIAVHADIDGDILRETVAHEVEHAITWAAGFRSSDQTFTEEEFVTRTTPLRVDTYRRNPALVRFLLGENR